MEPVWGKLPRSERERGGKEGEVGREGKENIIKFIWRKKKKKQKKTIGGMQQEANKGN